MPITIPVSIDARERLRGLQATSTKGVATHSAVLARLDAVLARFEMVSTRRDKVVAQQDALVASRKAQVDAAVAKAADIMGIEVAAAVLNLSKSEVRRASKATKAG